MLFRLVSILALCIAMMAHAESAGFDPVYEKQYNDQVRVQLLGHGDDGVVPREVQHWAYPENAGTSPDAAAMIRNLKALGFAAEPAELGKGVTFTHVVPVAGKEFDAITGKLRSFFASKNWSYDGWETVVVRKEVSS
jgi:hypothetical protein